MRAKESGSRTGWRGSWVPGVAGALCVGWALLTSASAAGEGMLGPMQVYFGTFGDGIYVSAFDPGSGRLGEARVVARLEGPSFLALTGDGGRLYCIHQMPGEGGKKQGWISGFRRDRATGALELINGQSTVGAGPCHVSLDAAGRCAFAANYGGGSVASFPVGDDGALRPAASFIQHEGSSAHPTRQKGPHAHSIYPDPSNRHVLAADLGIDRVIVYRLDAARATLERAGEGKLAPGAGPRHMAFHPDGRRLYVINELGNSVTAFRYDAATGTMTETQTIDTLPAGFAEKNTTAEVMVHPSGRFLYGSNRGHDTIAVFRIGEGDGRLELVEWEPIRGKTPRNFGIDPSGRFLLAAGMDSGTVAVFAIDPASGRLEFAGSEIRVEKPVCVKFAAGATR